jgi:hypothetical protein
MAKPFIYRSLQEVHGLDMKMVTKGNLYSEYCRGPRIVSQYCTPQPNTPKLRQIVPHVRRNSPISSFGNSPIPHMFHIVSMRGCFQAIPALVLGAGSCYRGFD